jgi:hypothetical protein
MDPIKGRMRWNGENYSSIINPDFQEIYPVGKRFFK